MIIIDSKLPAFRSLLSDRMTKKGLKADVDQSAVAANQEEGIGLDLQDDPSKQQNSQKESKGQSEAKKDESSEEDTAPTATEIKTKNMKLLNAL